MVEHVSGILSYVSIGSNQGNSLMNCQQAIDYIDKISDCKILRRSSWYRTEPIGVLDQEWFINGVIELRTVLSPTTLLMKFKAIERRMGRKETVKWGPRVIDLDILFYDQRVINQEDLIVPHPELHRRRFVLEPLNEIASYFIHPVFGISVSGLLHRLDDTSEVELLHER